MAESTPPKQVDAITAPPRPEAKVPFSVPQAPAQAQRRRLSRSWLMRIIVWVLLALPLVAVAVALYVVYALHQPQALHRQRLTPITPKSTKSTTTPAKTS